jgi:TET-Associated Glycosyltransferase
VNPQFPIYIVSKGRWHLRQTATALDRIGVPYRIIVERSEHAQYAAALDPKKVLTMPQAYLDQYDTCDDLGSSRSKGPGAARNLAWDHAILRGAAWHWVMDDNMDAFHRLNRNKKAVVDTGTIFKCAEDFVLRYENVAIAGFNYYAFVKETEPAPPFVLNTRIYSCLLIRNDLPYRWRARYNEDTDLCLRALKDGWVTVQFNAFLAGKTTTQRMRGGNTEEFYRTEGTKAKSEMIEKLHPDVAHVVWRFNRWHHHVDYRPFKKNKLQRRADAIIPEGVNNYGMVLEYD